MYTPCELQALYEQGMNITQLLREDKGLQYNTDEIIEIAYDLQTGSYIAAMDDPAMAEHKRDYTSEIAKTILSLCEPISVLEAGVGEATTLSGVLQHLKSTVSSFGFDLSWSRVAYAKRWLQRQNVSNATLCTGDLLHIPFADDSIDVVYTSHSIEPNGGNEEPILRELFRVTRRFLILLEPGYELANDEARRRMDFHGYCKNIKGTAEALGYGVLTHKVFPFVSNPLNPTAITIIQKEVKAGLPANILACPKFKTPLKRIGGMLFSAEALVVYPIVGGIPCLRIENGIFASKYQEIFGAG
jgi:ubiquinone/menaquinone biosynthesis C-methylase UbiE